MSPPTRIAHDDRRPPHAPRSSQPRQLGRRSADLVGCCVGDNRDRFFRELHRQRGYRFKRLLVVGTRDEIEAGTYRSDLSPKAVLATLSAIEARFDTPVVFAATPTDAGEQVETWAWWMAREMTTTANDLLRGCRVGEPICS